MYFTSQNAFSENEGDMKIVFLRSSKMKVIGEQMRKKVNLVSLYIYPHIYHSAVKNSAVLGCSAYDGKIKPVRICPILSVTSEISH